MGIHSNEEKITLQMKILLNAARCFLFIADFKSLDFSKSNLVQAYRRAAIKACTISLSCLPCLDANGMTTLFERDVRNIRSKAYVYQRKFNHAKNDLRVILKKFGSSQEVLKQLEYVDKQISRQRNQDKRLAKNICRWFQKVTVEDKDHDGGDGEISKKVEKGKICDQYQNNFKESLSHQTLFLTTRTLFMLCVFIFVFSIVVIKSKSSLDKI